MRTRKYSALKLDDLLRYREAQPGSEGLVVIKGLKMDDSDRSWGRPLTVSSPYIPTTFHRQNGECQRLFVLAQFSPTHFLPKSPRLQASTELRIKFLSALDIVF